MGIPGDLEDGYDEASALVDPILAGEVFKAADPGGWCRTPKARWSR